VGFASYFVWHVEACFVENNGVLSRQYQCSEISNNNLPFGTADLTELLNSTAYMQLKTFYIQFFSDVKFRVEFPYGSHKKLYFRLPFVVPRHRWRVIQSARQLRELAERRNCRTRPAFTSIPFLLQMLIRFPENNSQEWWQATSAFCRLSIHSNDNMRPAKETSSASCF